jgi:hypothetical protein
LFVVAFPLFAAMPSFIGADQWSSGASGGDVPSRLSVHEIAMANQRAFIKKRREEERLRLNDPFAAGRWVTFRGLQQKKALNGRIGMIIQGINEDGRIGVRLWGAARGEDKLLKTQNLEAFPDEEIVKIARYGADGERSGANRGVRTWFWPRRVLQKLRMELSPVSQMIGIPLCVAKVESVEAFSDRGDFDNQRMTYLMIDPLSGFAPDHWQAFVGPAVVWRASLQPLSSDDASLFHDFLVRIIDKYSNDKVNPMRDITPAAFRRSKARALNYEKLNPEDVHQSEDVNI